MRYKWSKDKNGFRGGDEVDIRLLAILKLGGR